MLFPIHNYLGWPSRPHFHRVAPTPLLHQKGVVLVPWEVLTSIPWWVCCMLSMPPWLPCVIWYHSLCLASTHQDSLSYWAFQPLLFSLVLIVTTFHGLKDMNFVLLISFSDLFFQHSLQALAAFSDWLASNDTSAISSAKSRFVKTFDDGIQVPPRWYLVPLSGNNQGRAQVDMSYVRCFLGKLLQECQKV